MRRSSVGFVKPADLGPSMDALKSEGKNNETAMRAMHWFCKENAADPASPLASFGHLEDDQARCACLWCEKATRCKVERRLSRSLFKCYEAANGNERELSAWQSPPVAPPIYPVCDEI